MDLVPYAVPFFLLAIALEYAWGRRTGNDTYRLNDSINSLSLGMLSTAIKLLGLNLAAAVFAWVFERHALFRPDPHSAWTYLWALLVYDFCYYWFHRIAHERTLFWASHVVHHQSEEFNLTTALRQTATGFLVSWIFYVPSFLLGIPAEVFVTVGSAHLIYQFWIHSRHIPKLGGLEWFLVTASNHRVHHAQNPDYVDRNYGGLLIVWDRLFGTFQEEREDEPCVYGILGPLRSWNPLWANLHIYAQMARDAWYTRRWSDKLRVLASRTGWRPADVAARFPVVKGDLASFRRFDPPLDAGVTGYVRVQFLCALLFSLWIEYAARDAGPLARYALFGYLLLALVGIGALMQDVAAGRRLEWLRIALTACGVGVLLLQGGAAAWLLPVAAIYLFASAFWLPSGRQAAATA
jgi:sterol desaturase/sphingolipid hydroxylase (fatty acid hydroxylase superfamily)